MALKHRLASFVYPRLMERRALEQRASPRVSVLMYHEVLPDAFTAPHWGVVRESQFWQQMAYLRANCHVLTLDQAVEQLQGRGDARSCERPSVVISFDDGYAGNLVCALPILEANQLPFVVFVATGMVEQGGCHWYDEVAFALLRSGRRSIEIRTSQGPLRYSGGRLLPSRRWAAVQTVLTALKRLPEAERSAITAELRRSSDGVPLRMLAPEEVRTLSRHPLVQIGCHTHGHELLDQVSAAVARGSIADAQERLATWTGVRPQHFSYPNGNLSLETKEVVRASAFRTAVTTQSRLWSPSDDLLEIPRIGIGRFDSLPLFRAKVSGFF